LIEELKTLGLEQLESGAKVADAKIRALNAQPETEENVQQRDDWIKLQAQYNQARAELLEEQGDLPPDVVVGLKPAYMRPRIAKGRPDEKPRLLLQQFMKG
jgi:hypothetical protein